MSLGSSPGSISLSRSFSSLSSDLDSRPMSPRVQVPLNDNIDAWNTHARPAAFDKRRSASALSAQPHERFFFPNEFVALRIESTVFHLPSFILTMHSVKFKKLLAARTHGVAIEQIVIQNTKEIDFERLLTVLIPSVPGNLELTSVEEWISVLTVAHAWEFHTIEALALAQIEPIASAVDKVVLGQEYNLPQWTTAGYMELCQREDPISRDEGRRLDRDLVIDLSIVRHHVHCGTGGDKRVDAKYVKEAVMSRPYSLQDNLVACLLKDSLFTTDEKDPPSAEALTIPSTPSSASEVSLPSNPASFSAPLAEKRSSTTGQRVDRALDSSRNQPIGPLQGRSTSRLQPMPDWQRQHLDEPISTTSASSPAPIPIPPPWRQCTTPIPVAPSLLLIPRRPLSSQSQSQLQPQQPKASAVPYIPQLSPQGRSSPKHQQWSTDTEDSEDTFSDVSTDADSLPTEPEQSRISRILELRSRKRELDQHISELSKRVDIAKNRPDGEGKELMRAQTREIEKALKKKSKIEAKILQMFPGFDPMDIPPEMVGLTKEGSGPAVIAAVERALEQHLYPGAVSQGLRLVFAQAGGKIGQRQRSMVVELLTRYGLEHKANPLDARIITVIIPPA